jgi:transcription termination factor Rho
MTYDILQLNDMLVPELLDIAEQLKIEGGKKLDKQQLIYTILDKQAIMASENKNGGEEKPKRKRIIKTSTATGTEEAIVESGDQAPAPTRGRRKKEESPAPPAEQPVAEKKQPEMQVKF